MWHVSNEYGHECHCPLCQEAFRTWLRKKYNNDLDALNKAWWAAFWGHTYRSWDEIESPSPIGERSIHGLELDWHRGCGPCRIAAGWAFFLPGSIPAIYSDYRRISRRQCMIAWLMSVLAALAALLAAPFMVHAYQLESYQAPQYLRFVRGVEPAPVQPHRGGHPPRPLAGHRPGPDRHPQRNDADRGAAPRDTDIAQGAIVKNSVVMESCKIGANVILENVILDRNTTISNDVVLQGTPDKPVVLGKETAI